ncbi:aminoglycoside N(3)-acetyltransferase [Streptomyces sp. BI20]|uniref:aminoglycoside N(3)-acetyltransferase n=1 Tax=Streptomyces sp. BI20 TaxID=3403460 RepID=UPI003C719035
MTALARDLARLGLSAGARVLVHAALRGTGLRAEELAAALRRALGPEGTLVVPAFTPENSAGSRAHLARVAGLDPAGARAFRARMPAFDPARTPGHGTGVFAERIRTAPGAARSEHPQSSFAALGRDAERICADHAWNCHLGEKSPLGTLGREGGQVLMINVGFDACTAFHLAEYRVPSPETRTYCCVVGLPEGDRWIGYRDIALDDTDFARIGAAIPPRLVRDGRLGSAGARLFPIAGAVAHAVAWMTENRR